MTGADSETGDDVTTHETGRARAWLRTSMPGISTGCGSGWCWSREDDEEEEERRVEGKPREDRYVEAVRNRSLAQAGKS
jgi:hypothetical protein